MKREIVEIVNSNFDALKQRNFRQQMTTWEYDAPKFWGVFIAAFEKDKKVADDLAAGVEGAVVKSYAQIDSDGRLSQDFVHTVTYAGVEMVPYKFAWNKELYKFRLWDNFTSTYEYGERLVKVMQEMAKQGVSEPNAVGKSTAKKLKDWADYLTAAHTKNRTQLSTIQATKDAFLATLPADAQVEYKANSNDLVGYFDKGCFRFSFWISEKAVDTEISIVNYHKPPTTLAQLEKMYKAIYE